jgi:hypothetical protein
MFDKEFSIPYWAKYNSSIERNKVITQYQLNKELNLNIVKTKKSKI